MSDFVINKITEEINLIDGFTLTKIGDGRTTKELLRDGRYKFVHSYINPQNFPVRSKREGLTKLALLGFDQKTTSREVIFNAKKLGLKPPIYEDIFYFGIECECPNIKQRWLIVFLHEPVNLFGDPMILCLWSDYIGRALRPVRFNIRWTCDSWLPWFAFVH